MVHAPDVLPDIKLLTIALLSIIVGLAIAAGDVNYTHSKAMWQGSHNETEMCVFPIGPDILIGHNSRCLQT